MSTGVDILGLTIASTFQRIALREDEGEIAADANAVNLEIQGTDGKSWKTALDISTNRIGINQSDPAYTLDINSTTAIRIPVGTTEQGNALTDAAGLMRYNTSKAQFEGNDGTNWLGLGGVIDIAQTTYISASGPLASPSQDGTLRFYTAGVERMNISSSGAISFANDLDLGSLALTGTITGPDGGSLSINSDSDIKLYLDVDGNSDSSLLVYNGTPAQIMGINESGDLTILGDLSVEGGKITLSNGSIISSEVSGKLSLTEDVVEVSAALKVGGNIIQASDGGTAIQLDDSDNVTVGNNLVVGGGLITLTNGSFIDSTSAGTLTLDEDKISVNGNLEVLGSTVTVNSTTVQIDDPVFEIGESVSDDNLDRGIKINYNNVGAKVAFMGFNDSDHKFALIPEATESPSSVFAGTQGILKADLEGQVNTASQASITAIANLVTVGTITTGEWNGTPIANDDLANDSVSYGGISVDLGSADATPAFDLIHAHSYVGDTDLVTVGALNSGSITSGFGNIDNGASSIACGSLDVSDGNITNVGSIDLDSIQPDGTTITIGGIPSIVLTNDTTILMTLGNDSGDDFTIKNTDDDIQLVVQGDTGNVGIGRSNPIHPLHVVHDFPRTNTEMKDVAIFGSNETGSGETGQLQFRIQLQGAVVAEERIVALDTTCQSGSSNDGVLALQSAAGKVGIGTKEPERLLHVKSSDADIASFEGHQGEGMVFSSTTSGQIDIVGYDDGDPGYNNMLLRCGSTDQLFLSTTSYVGIGANLPQALLTIQATESDTSPSYGGIGYQAADDGIWHSQRMNTSHTLVWDTYTGVIIDDTQIWNIGLTQSKEGKVGIGTESPAVKLTISDAHGDTRYTTNSHTRYLMFDAATSGGGGLIWNKQASGNNRAILSNNGQLEIGRSTADDASQAWLPDFTIDNIGNIGIGTTSPNAQLEIYGGELYVFNSGLNPRILLGDSNGPSDYGFMKWDSTDDCLQFGTEPDGVSMTINESGNIGINVEDPDEKLEIDGVVHLGQQASAPSSAADKLYNENGILKWAGSVVGTFEAAEAAFMTIKITGQDDVVADAGNDDLIFVEAGAMTITTDAATDTITFNSLNTNQLTTFILEGDSNTSTISQGETLKISGTAPLSTVESGGIITITLADGGIDADALNVTGSGSVGQYLESEEDGSFRWSTPVSYALDAYTDNGIFLRLTGSDSTTDSIKFTGTGATVVSWVDNSTIGIASTNTTYTDAEIKTKYENNTNLTYIRAQVAAATDSNVFADTYKTALDNATSASTASTLVYRDSGKNSYHNYLYTSHVNCTGSVNNGTITHMVTEQDSDNWLRYSTAGPVRTFLGLDTDDTVQFGSATVKSQTIFGDSGFSTFFNAQNDGAAGATFKRVANADPYNYFLFQNGNVGIGEDTPLQRLVIKGKYHAFTLKDTGTEANGYSQMLIQAGTSTNYFWTNNENTEAGKYGGAKSLNIYTGAGGNMAFFTNGDSEQDTGLRMIILGGGTTLDEDGNSFTGTVGDVGIGTSAPVTKLDVRGNMRLGDGSSVEQDILFESANGSWQVGTNNSGNGTNDNQFYIYETYYRFVVQNGTGNVGINTLAPGYKLDVNGDINLTGDIYIDGTLRMDDHSLATSIQVPVGSLNYGMTALNAPADSGDFWRGDGKWASTPDTYLSPYISLSTPTSSTVKLTLTAAGTNTGGYTDAVTFKEGNHIELTRSTDEMTINVDTTDLLALGVYWDLGGENVRSEGIYTYSAGTSNPVYISNGKYLGAASSLRAHKTNITPLSDSLALLNKIEPVSFNYLKQDEDGQFIEGSAEDVLDTGMIAEDLEEVSEDLCMYDEDGTLRGIRYQLLVPHLIKAVQELTAKVEALENP